MVHHDNIYTYNRVVAEEIKVCQESCSKRYIASILRQLLARLIALTKTADQKTKAGWKGCELQTRDISFSHMILNRLLFTFFPYDIKTHLVV